MGKSEIKELIDGVLSAVGNQVVSIILYGSVARGEESEESDVDIAIILHDNLSAKSQDILSEIIVDMDLKHDKVYSIVDIKESDYEKWKKYIPFYKNVDKEGVVLWKAG